VPRYKVTVVLEGESESQEKVSSDVTHRLLDVAGFKGKDVSILKIEEVV